MPSTGGGTGRCRRPIHLEKKTGDEEVADRVQLAARPLRRRARPRQTPREGPTIGASFGGLASLGEGQGKASARGTRVPAERLWRVRSRRRPGRC